MGYLRAGFTDIVGVDIKPQPRYPFEFVQGDALEYLAEHGSKFDLIHASPPCQAYSRATAWRGTRSNHPDMIGSVRIELVETHTSYVIENVQEARVLLRNPIMLCGSHFGLPIRRHRYFEIPSLGLVLTHVCRHLASDFSHDHGGKQTESVYRDALGCTWMTVQDAREAIPPAYTEWIGRQLLEYNVLGATGVTKCLSARPSVTA